MPLEVSESFEKITDAELDAFAAVIVPSGMVSDRLRYTEDVTKLPPIDRATGNPSNSQPI